MRLAFEVYILRLFLSHVFAVLANNLAFLNALKLSSGATLSVDYSSNYNAKLFRNFIRPKANIELIRLKQRMHRKVDSRRKRRVESDIRKPVLSGYRIDDKAVIVEYE